ncbi:MAG: YlmC/YmxH family sporulation protein [Tissierellaceae bacterium]|nr:YlmC/YmxH family sporulation protein [Tissierellaceae bacterium]
MLKISEAKMKEVINIANGERLGYIYDFEIDLDKGEIVAMVMSSSPKSLSFFSKPNDIIIQWHEIVKIGQDTILVNFNG